MTTIKHTPHYAAQQARIEEAEKRIEIHGKLEMLTTLILCQVVVTPIAVITGLFMHDPVMIAGAIGVSGVAGLATLYALRRLGHHIDDL